MESWLKDIAVPIAALIVSVVAIFWNYIQSRWNRHYFQTLILRELQEVGPFPREPNYKNLQDHLQKDFIHRKIFDNAESNRDFILSLDATLVYMITQLWSAFKHNNVEQWLFFLCEISKCRMVVESDKKTSRKR